MVDTGILKLSLLDKRIKAFLQGYRQNIALIGHDREEIAFLLDTYLENNKSPELIYLHTTTAYAGKKDFAKSLVKSLLENFNASLANIDALINQTEPKLPITTGLIKELLRKNTFTLQDILDIVNKFIIESNKRCVLIVEEFIDLKTIFPNCLKDFSKFIILQRGCMIILATSRQRETQKILASELNLLFGDFEKIFLNEKNFTDSYLHLKKCLDPMPATPFLISFLVNILGDNVIYHRLICEILKKNYGCDCEDDMLVATLTETLYRDTTYFFQKFLKNIDIIAEKLKDRDAGLKILLAITDGYIRKKDLSSLNICNNKELAGKLSKLVDSNYVLNYGEVYGANDPLFGFWLANIFKLHFAPAELNRSSRKTAWEQRIRQEISAARQDFYKDKINQVFDLIGSFKDDSLKIGKDRYRLPLIDHKKIVSDKDKGTHIVIGDGQEIVVLGIKENTVEDNDITEFMEKGSNIKGKKVKKIFISLDKFSHSAKLIAKENHFITWDIDDVNNLMKAYNRPIISTEKLTNASFSTV